MKEKSNFEIYFATVVLFLFLTVLMFAANMAFYHNLVNMHDTFHWKYITFLATLQTGFFMALIAFTMRNRYKKAEKLIQVKAFSVYLSILAILVFSFAALLFPSKTQIYNHKQSTSEFLKEHFDELVNDEQLHLDSQDLMRLIENEEDTAFGSWTRCTVNDKDINYKYRFPSEIYDDTSFLMIQGKTLKKTIHFNLSEDTYNDNIRYEFSTIKIDSGMQDLASEILAHETNALKQLKNGKLLQESRYSKDKLQGKELVIDFPYDRSKLFSRIFLYKNYVFILSVRTGYNALNNKNIDNFLDGFKIL